MINSITAFILSFIITVVGFAFPAGQTVTEKGKETEISNPLGGGSDPWYYEHDGMYYYCWSLGNGAAVAKSDTISGLFTAEWRRVYTAPEGTGYSYSWWAPEIHFIDGKWYIYVAADNGENANHRMYAFVCDTPDGDYEFAGKVYDSSDKWAIDGTPAEINGELYFIWSGWENDEDGEQRLYIAHMKSPTEIDSQRVLISTPSYLWEKHAMPINEGPEVLINDGKVFIVYSASGSWTDDYCLGMLTLTGENPLKKSSWTKCPIPVFSKTKSAYGPGHCSFTTDENGDTFIVYHANVESGTGWNGRSVRIQQIHFTGGYPAFGRPVKVS